MDTIATCKFFAWPLLFCETDSDMDMDAFLNTGMSEQLRVIMKKCMSRSSVHVNVFLGEVVPTKWQSREGMHRSYRSGTFGS